MLDVNSRDGRYAKLRRSFSLNELIRCFDDTVPDSIIVGGSYTTDEQNITKLGGDEYWLSDIDLLCIREGGFSIEESKRVYRRMLKFSTGLNQRNSYFHIGLKLRSPEQLLNEVRTLYFRELSETSFSIHGKSIAEYFDISQVFGFFYDGQQPCHDVNAILLSCATTRLWCNVLFFPSILFRCESQPHKLWYNYFFSRGCLDWITWQLIQEGMWVSGYRNRYIQWRKLETVEDWQIQIMESCLETKLGKNNIDYREIISPSLRLAFSYISRLSNSLFGGVPTELEFVSSMNRFIEAKVKRDMEQQAENHLFAARKLLCELIGKDIAVGLSTTNEDEWLALRRVYSEFRFARNPLDRMDHEVYTDHFLQLGT